MSSANFQKIYETILTTQQRDKFVQNIDDFVSSIYTKGSVAKKINAIFPIEKSEVIVEILDKEKISLKSIDEIKDFFSELQENIKRIQTIDLTIAIEPTLVQVRKISDWIEVNSKEKLFLNIIVDARILGGAIIGVKGFYKDESLRKRLSGVPITL